jgi:hypothetical protein
MPFSRTLHFLQDKADIQAVFYDEYCVPNTLVAQEANNWADYIRDNFSELQDIKNHRDPLLPIRIEVAITNETITIIEKLWNSPGILGLPGNSQDGHFWVIRNWPWNLSGIRNVYTER